MNTEKKKKLRIESRISDKKNQRKIWWIEEVS